MEIRHLKYFLIVAEELSFTKAAEKLFISQPPLSRQIKELEEELGARLFHRNNKKVELTNAGKYFAAQAKGILQLLDKACIQTKKLADNVSGEFKIGYLSSTFSVLISELLQVLSKTFPYVNFKLYEVSTHKQMHALEQGKLDFGILRAPIYSPRIKTQLWFEDSYSLVFNNHLMTLEAEESISLVKNETFIFYNRTYAPEYYNSLIRICASYGFSPNVVHEANNVSSIIQMVKNGLGISIVPSTVAKNYEYSEVTFLELKRINLTTQVLLATSIDEESSIARLAIDFLQKRMESLA